MSKPIKFDRTPPQNLEAERSVLGAMLMNPDAIATAFEVLQGEPADIFYAPAHQHIYAAIVELSQENKPVDVVMLTEKMIQRGTLEKAGGGVYIGDLPDAVPTSANIEYYSQIVMEMALRRRLIAVAAQCAADAFDPNGEVSDLLDKAEAEIFSLAQTRQTNKIQRVSELLEDGIARIQKQMEHDGGITGLATGYHQLDQMLSGLQPSDMIILAARPSVGKTAFSLNVAANAATTHDKSVLVFSLEMAREQLTTRLLCMVGQINTKRLSSGFLARNEMSKIQHAADMLGKANIYIDDTPNIGILELRSKARKHKAQHPLDLVIIDYLQLMSGSSRSESRQVEISEISRAIKGLARELSCPIIALSQLSREAEKDGSGTPKLSHLRESGAIEQDADVVMMLSRPAPSEGQDLNQITLTIAKQRNGPTGGVPLLFEKDVQRFKNLDGAAPIEAPPESQYIPKGGFPEDYYEEDDTPF